MFLVVGSTSNSQLLAFGNPKNYSRVLPPCNFNGRKRGILSLGNHSRKHRVAACCFNLPEEPILKEALKEPVAFMGGVFAGLLRLDMNEDPLREWVARTVEASGLTKKEINSEDLKPEEEAPQQIEIE